MELILDFSLRMDRIFKLDIFIILHSIHIKENMKQP